MGTRIWNRYVLEDAVTTLRQLVGERPVQRARVLDAGCGQGQSFPLLDRYFEPGVISGIDMDEEALENARSAGSRCRCEVEIHHGSAQALDIPSNSLDMVFCHQLIHHVTYREEVMAEFFRVLKPGGLLLLGESCRCFLNIYWVRWLFRHPRMVQKTAAEYVRLVRDAGFRADPHDLVETTPWWSRRDFGLLETMGLQFWKPRTTEIFLVATKPGATHPLIPA